MKPRLNQGHKSPHLLERRSLDDGYQTPTFGIDFHGSAGACAGPFWRSSTEILSGERMKAIFPSRGGRLMTTPWSARCWQVA